MGLKINTIISLASNEKFVLLNETMYGGIKYFLAMGVDDNKDIIPNKVKILEEMIKGTDVYVKAVTDPEMIIILTRILKSQM
ncbi:MAG: hypothetical protein IJ572_04050 [Bacilli bacterium]|nr:hypothetical protein [Bacilli bacterium]